MVQTNNRISFIYPVLGLLFLFLSFNCQSSKPKKTEEADSLDYKIGQMLLIGFRGQEALEDSDIYHLIKHHHIGGVVIYHRDLPSQDRLERNVISKNQFIRLTNQLQAITPEKLIISIDEEGGRVSRLSSELGFMTHKSHQAIGNINHPDTTRRWANQMSTELASLGINMNFAPVVDLNINPMSPAIGKIERSFSADPQEVLIHAAIFMEEHRKQNIVCVPKHFPGHGSARTDSHRDLTDVTQTWSEAELIPYEALIAAGQLDIVMTAHVYNAQLDSFPSTLSPKIIRQHLKEAMGFDGVVISDDMQMGAIYNHYGFETSIEKAILAGVDILLLSNNSFQVGYDPEIALKAIQHIKNLLEKGIIDEQRIDESYRKIMALKTQM